MVRKAILASVGLCVLWGCAETAAPAATVAEKDAATKNYLTCLHRAATAADDHMSDASTIAVAIRGMCSDEFSSSREVFSRGMSPGARAIFIEQGQGTALQMATEMVLKVRREQQAK
jgi:hypothetical protein